MNSNTQQRGIVSAAAELAPQIRAVREELETLSHLPESLVGALDRVGLFQMFLPRSMGGLETDPITGFCAIEELSKIDGSVGWCCMISSQAGLLSGWLDVEVGASLFGQPPEARCAGSLRPEGQARLVDGGYVVSGRWDFASGVDSGALVDQGSLGSRSWLLKPKSTSKISSVVVLDLNAESEMKNYAQI